MSRTLAIIVGAELFGTSLWFSANAVADSLLPLWGGGPGDIGALTSAVQAGFIAGTLTFALTGFADRYPASRIFAGCALLGALFNAALAWQADSLGVAVLWRFATGFALAGIYPVGMKLVVSWTPQHTGHALGWLVGMLTLGTALPHLVRAVGWALDWRAVIVTSSLAALLAAAMVLRLGDGPHLVRRAGGGAALSPRALGVVWVDPKLRASVLGYFGHMWELYAFFVLLPAMVALRWSGATAWWWVFGAISMGLFSCVGGGMLANRFGGARVAGVQLACSGTCCLLAPWLLEAPLALWAAWLLLWGATVSGDSPQFSALTARNAPPHLVGSVLTLVNSIGFTISVVSIALFASLATVWPLGEVLPWLAVGPLIGVLCLRPLLGAAREAAPAATRS